MYNIIYHQSTFPVLKEGIIWAGCTRNQWRAWQIAIQCTYTEYAQLHEPRKSQPTTHCQAAAAYWWVVCISAHGFTLLPIFLTRNIKNLVAIGPGQVRYESMRWSSTLLRPLSASTPGASVWPSPRHMPGPSPSPWDADQPAATTWSAHWPPPLTRLPRWGGLQPSLLPLCWLCIIQHGAGYIGQG